jgi:hypothetical protein
VNERQLPHAAEHICEQKIVSTKSSVLQCSYAEEVSVGCIISPTKV